LVILEAIWRLGRLLDAVIEVVLEAVEVFLPVELFAVVAEEEVLKELFDDVEGTAAGEAVEAVAVEAAEVAAAAAAAAVAVVDSEAVLAVADPAPPAPKDPKNKRY
jgi:hypothetical protein